MNKKGDNPVKDTNIIIDNKNDIDVVDSNLTLDSTEERPGVGYEIFGIGTNN